MQAGAEVGDLTLQVLVGGIVFGAEQGTGGEQHRRDGGGDAGVSQGVPVEHDRLAVTAVTGAVELWGIAYHRKGGCMVVGATPGPERSCCRTRIRTSGGATP